MATLSDIGKRLLVGRKLRSSQMGQTLLPKRIALPVFASDALSSVAYAPDEILLTLSLAGLAAYAFSWKVAIAVAVVMLVVLASYRQNVHAYPSGGGDYEVATVNLGPNAGLTVGSALMVDYVLTVAVSISSGVQNAKSVPALHFLDGHEALAASIGVVVLMALNLRGMRQSGRFLALPTYCFILGVLVMVGYGLYRILVAGEPLQAESARFGIEPDPDYAAFTGFAMVALLARSFSSGCAALTGVGAISNGVPAFRQPKSRNAATTLLLLGAVAVTMVVGVVVLARLTGVKLVDGVRSHYTLDGQRFEPSRRPASPSSPTSCSPSSGPASTSSWPRPSSSCSWPPTPRSTASRCSARSWPATATCPVSCTPAGTGWPTATASSCSPSSPSC